MPTTVTVTLLDGSHRTFVHPLSVMEVAHTIGAGLARNAVAGKLDGRLVDACDLIVHHHDHLVCTTCGRVQEFHDETIEQKQRKIAMEHGFEVVEHSHILFGRRVKNPCEYRRCNS